MEDTVLAAAEERWLPVVGYEGLYEVSDWGRVKSLERLVRHSRGGRQILRSRVLKSLRHRNRRLEVALCRGGGVRRILVHRLVLEAFVGPCPEEMEACHGDGDPSNNRLENLRWDTRKANCADRLRHGTLARGERNGLAKLARGQVLVIRADPRSCWKIAQDYDINPTTVSQIKRRKIWAWLEDFAKQA